MRITREEYKEYLRRKHGKQPNNLTIFTTFMDNHIVDIDKAFKGTNIKAIELDD